MSFLVTQLVSLGATGFILASASSGRISRLLKRGVFQFLGRTSYSFYLSHFLFLLTVAPLLYLASGSYLIAWLGTLAVTYLVSDLLFKFVEAPGCGSGRGHLVSIPGAGILVERKPGRARQRPHKTPDTHYRILSLSPRARSA